MFPCRDLREDGITVVIPTYNRRELLAYTLESLCKQDSDKSCFEVIVVDDGSNDGTRDMISQFVGRIDIRYYFQEDRGFRVAAARNVGIRHAHFAITLFIDSGILVSSRLITLHMHQHRNSYPLAVIGLSYGVMEHEETGHKIIPYSLTNGVDSALNKLINYPEVHDCRTQYLHSINFDLAKMVLPWLIFWSGHVSAPTKLLCQINGFDEWFQHWGGEDVELGLRLFQAGCSFQMLPSVESIHYPHPRDTSRIRRDSIRNSLYIHQKHQLRQTKLLAYHDWITIEIAERSQKHLSHRSELATEDGAQLMELTK